MEFEQAARDRREDVAYRDKMHRAQLLERDREEKAEKREQERDDIVAVALAFALPEDIAAFRADLDIYDTATVDALMDNGEALERNRKKIDEALEQASVLPDGRRVFKTRDGQRVFDETGAEISLEEIDPNCIDNKKPKWETYKGYKDEDARLLEEGKELSNYQAKLDAARDRLDKGEITNKELDAMKASLKADMPEVVREKAGLEKLEASAARKKDVEADFKPTATDALMRQTGLGPAAPAP